MHFRSRNKYPDIAKGSFSNTIFLLIYISFFVTLGSPFLFYFFLSCLKFLSLKSYISLSPSVFSYFCNSSPQRNIIVVVVVVVGGVQRTRMGWSGGGGVTVGQREAAILSNSHCLLGAVRLYLPFPAAEMMHNPKQSWLQNCS